MTDPQQQIEELLLERGLIKPDQLEKIHQSMEEEGKTLVDVIQEEKLIYSEQLAQVKAQALGVPYMDLSSVTPSPQAMRDISKQAAATYRFVAFDERDGKLLVGMDEPENFQALEAVKFIARKRGLSPEIYVASKDGIDRLLGGSSEIQVEIGSALRDFSQEVASTDIEGKNNRDLEKYIEEAPVTKVVAVIIRHAIEGNASDIHIEPTDNELRIRYRIDGKLHTSLIMPKRVHSAVISRVKILSSLKIDESRLPQDGRFSITMDEHSYDFRISTMPTIYGEKVAMRILDKSQGAPSFEELGLWGRQHQIFTHFLSAPHGIILISGPTGAGKSTTLFSALSQINSADANISTLEDPVEYEIKGVNQTQINPDIGFTFATGLRNLLRQDPDVLMVGEIRDTDTAAMAIHSSLTGHLVLSTIHTNDAIGAIPRMVDMGIDPFLLTATLRVLVAQRLVGKLCEKCRREIPIPEKMREQIEKTLSTVPEEFKQESNQSKPEVLFEAPGCPACHETGLSGRLGIFEVVPITRQLREVITDTTVYDKLVDTARSQGLISMQQDGTLKALQGHVRYEDVLRVTSGEGS